MIDIVIRSCKGRRPFRGHDESQQAITKEEKLQKMQFIKNTVSIVMPKFLEL